MVQTRIETTLKCTENQPVHRRVFAGMEPRDIPISRFRVGGSKSLPLDEV